MANKVAKKALRRQQRVKEAVSRKAFYTSLMDTPSSNAFYQLYRKANPIKKIVPPVCRGWCQTHRRNTPAKVLCSIYNSKSPDEYGEHVTAGKSVLVPVITKIFNHILDTKKFASVFKTGVINPVLKNERTQKLLENYRRITVTAILGKVFRKVFEYAFLEKLHIAQSEMQFGFTEGLSPSTADLLISEAKVKSQENKTHIYVATLDSQMAFHVVHHAILLDKLLQSNMHDTSWLVIKDLSI